VLPQVTATRYVTPLREGGSLPGLMEADDLGTYVVKFSGAGQGRKTLVAEVICSRLAKGLGLATPDLALVDVDPGLAPAEPDQEVQDLLRASAGRNLGMDYLRGSRTLDPAADGHLVDPAYAARVLWLDALTLNVDRSWRNPNVLRWHGRPWLIDHGAALYFHHDWARAGSAGTRAYAVAADHVFAGLAGPLAEAHEQLAPRVDADLLDEVTALVPDGWLAEEPGAPSPQDLRGRYRDVLLERVHSSAAWLPDVEERRAARV
jgi:hypothetical protein